MMKKSVIKSVSLLGLLLLLQACTTTHLHTYPMVVSFDDTAADVSPGKESVDAGIKVMTLNLAHGRGEHFHQMLLDDETTLGNLDQISELLISEAPDVVALQEADGPSFWSGDLNHVAYLASQGHYRQSVRGVHADGPGLSYGTALISRVGLQQPESVAFDPAYSFMPKGFVVSTIVWPDGSGIEVDIVSLHLTFSSEQVRRKQAAELIDVLQVRNRPVIIMGDFNTEWQSENSSVQFITEALGLSAYQPEMTGLETFPGLGRRLDWILVSPDFEFRSYRLLPDIVSDHRGVIAELVLKTGRKHPLIRNPG
jgi:endonuclease/exonuclease/phosphatase family metal-dependent hydrolase